jgi:hypothetical protein
MSIKGGSQKIDLGTPNPLLHPLAVSVGGMIKLHRIAARASPSPYKGAL